MNKTSTLFYLVDDFSIPEFSLCTQDGCNLFRNDFLKSVFAACEVDPGIDLVKRTLNRAGM